MIDHEAKRIRNLHEISSVRNAFYVILARIGGKAIGKSFKIEYQTINKSPTLNLYTAKQGFYLKSAKKNVLYLKYFFDQEFLSIDLDSKPKKTVDELLLKPSIIHDAKIGEGGVKKFDEITPHKFIFTNFNLYRLNNLVERDQSLVNQFYHLFTGKYR